MRTQSQLYQNNLSNRTNQPGQKTTVQQYTQATGHKNIKKQRGWDSNPR